MWQTSSVYPGKEHRRSLTPISEVDNHSNDVGEAECATAPVDLDWFLLKHQELISRPVAAFLHRSAKHENVYLFIFLLMLSPDDIIRILLAVIYYFKLYEVATLKVIGGHSKTIKNSITICYPCKLFLSFYLSAQLYKK